MVELNHISFSYGKKPVLADITAKIQKGSLTAVIGLNGAGKSTLFGCLSKQLYVQSGKVLVENKNIKDYSYRDYAKLISFVPQLSSMKETDYKVRDFLVEGRTPYLSAFAVPSINEYLFVEKVAERIGINGFLDFDFAKLSGGQQQLILLARALVQDTPLIILDEPMSALDLRNQSFLLKVISQLSDEGKTIIFSTHNPNHALLLGCDVLLMKDGKVICHDTADKCLSAENMYKVFGESVKLISVGNKSQSILVI